jgi:CubicO group peptidase (beta-lactamase class C family)
MFKLYRFRVSFQLYFSIIIKNSGVLFFVFLLSVSYSYPLKLNLSPTAYGISPNALISLTDHLQKKPVYSFLISKDGNLIYEYYSQQLNRSHNYYLMSVTKSFTSTMYGIALSKKKVPKLKSKLSEIIPADYFKNSKHQNRFKNITIENVMGMSALNALVPPHGNSQADKERQINFFQVSNRFRFALEQNTLAKPGQDFQYQDITPELINGILKISTGKNIGDYAKENLFEPLGFQNYDWQHPDPEGNQLAAYGLRLRAVDMQKFGILYLNEGLHEGKRIFNKEWVATVKKPTTTPYYGTFFWHAYYGENFSAYMAAGWRGQIIAIFPEAGIVITYTSCFMDGSENDFMNKTFAKYLPKLLKENKKKNTKAAERLLIKRLTRANKRNVVNFSKLKDKRMLPEL